MYRKILFVILTLLSFMFISCKKEDIKIVKNQESIDIISTSFFAYDIAKNIVGDKLDVKLALEPGKSGHSKAAGIKPSTMLKLKYAKLLLYTSFEIDGWLISDDKKGYLPENVFDISKYVFKEKKEDENLKLNTERKNQIAHANIHYWTSIDNIIKASEGILEQIIKIDSKNNLFYKENCNKYIQNFKSIKKDFQTYLNEKRNVLKTPIVLIGHDAMGAFSIEFDLNIKAMCDTLEEKRQPKPSEIKEVLDTVKKYNLQYVYKPELGENINEVISILEQLKNQGYTVTALELNGYHNISKKQYDNNVSYTDILKQNIKNIKELIK